MIVESRERRCHFTLRELLVVVAIVALGFAVLTPALRKAREDGYRIECTNNLKPIGLGIHAFHDQRREICPSYLTGDRSPAAIPNGFMTWPIILLPWLEGSGATWYEVIDETVPLDKNAPRPADHAAVRTTVVSTYICPSRRTPSSNLGDYGSVSLANAARNAIELTWPRTWDAAILPCMAFKPKSSPSNPDTRRFRSLTDFANVTDGLTHTAFIGEKAVHQDRLGDKKTDATGRALPSEQDGTFYYGRGGEPANLQAPGAMAYWSRRLAPAYVGERLLPAKPRLEDPHNRFGGWHEGVTLFLMGDGSVKAVSNDTDSLVLQRLGCRNDGQKIDLP